MVQSFALVFFVVPTITGATPTRHRAQFDEMLECRSQTVSVRLASTAVADRAVVRPLPLFGGAAWAITSRWDDNHLADLKTREVLLAHGHRGTFFLNDPARGFYGNSYGLLGDFPPSDLGRLLIGRGITIGGHSLTHPMLGYQNRNRMFEEVLGSRIALEAAFDTFVNAYAFSFCHYRNPIEETELRRDIAIALGRAGYLQIANHRFADDGAWPLGVACLLPPDGRPIDDQFTRFLDDELQQRDNPAITFSMHSWYSTPEAWAKFEAELDRYGHRQDWWYCNHNEYGGYRAQYTRAVQGRLSRGKGIVSFTFDRPLLIDLNDAVPLTFEIAGVEADDVSAIEATDAKVTRCHSPDDPIRFHLHHPADQQLPKHIDRVRTDSLEPKASSEFPGIEGHLSLVDKDLSLRLRNGGAAPLERVRVVYRLPLLAESGVIRRRRFELLPGETHVDKLAIGRIRSDSRYRAGAHYAAAQIDFLRSGAWGRLYVTTHAPETMDDASYPSRGFSILGPIPHEAFDATNLRPSSIRQKGWSLADGRQLVFRPVDPEIAKSLSVEVIPARGRWDNRGLKPCAYLLAATVDSPRSREVRFLCNRSTVREVYLGDQRVGDSGTLEKGENELLLVYQPPVGQRYSPEHAGAAFRMVDAATRSRVDDIAYRPLPVGPSPHK